MDSVKESFNEASTGSMPAWRKEGATASVHMNEDIMDWAAGSSSSPLSGSGNVSSSAVIDKDAQVNDSERTDGKWRHESSTEESCGIATPFSSKKHNIEQGLFIGSAVGTSLTKKMTVNWQDDTACDADFSTRCCDHFSHCGGLGGSIAMATMRAQLGQMSHFSRLAKCCLAKRLLGDGDVKRIPSEVSGATTVSCGDVAECVLVKKRRKKKVPKRRKNFCSAGLGWCSFFIPLNV
uniref:Uncharacterized protein n=2 Tax=Parascaris univalens TaxID=6257 RepID=A0A914ZZW3_PARUN